MPYPKELPTALEIILLAVLCSIVFHTTCYILFETTKG